jgi:hypothetical protein
MSLESVFRLGWAYAKVLGRKLVGVPVQLQRFVRQYERDGIVLFEPGDDDIVAGASRCVACGRCDVVALQMGAFDALGPRGPMAFVLGVSRHTSLHDQAEIDPAAGRAALERLRAACPADVPFVELAALVRRRQRALNRVRGNGVTALPVSPDDASPRLEAGRE